jgi:winged helix DNA-binding protein
MTLTAQGLNRATLGRQMLLAREAVSVTDAVHRVVAVQAQEPAGPYLALWNRIAPFDPADLDAAFADYAIVKGNMVRMTLHAIRADDFRAFREAVDPSLRAARLDQRFTRSGLTPADADALVPELLEFTREVRTAVECEAWLDERLGGKAGRGAWAGLRQYAPMLRATTGGPWSFGPRLSYVAPPGTPTLGDSDVSAEGLKTYVRRFLTGFGPASIADAGLFGMIYRGPVKAAVTAMGDELERLEGPDGSVLYDVPGGLMPDPDTPAPPRLLGMWDNALLAYTDRGRIIPPEIREHVTRRNGDVLPTLLVDGYVAGVWRAVEDGIEATALRPISAEAWEGLAAEARDLLAMLGDRDPLVFSRYGRWWAQMPRGEVRVLTAS